MRQIEGSQLAKEGVFEQEMALFPKSDPPKLARFYVEVGKNKSSLERKISNAVSCDVQSLLSEDTAKPMP